MALLRYNRYPGNWLSPTTSSPQGAFKNKSSANATDGSYAEADWLNDWDGFFSRLLGQAGISPNGSVDTALSSQYYTALATLIGRASPTGMIAPFAQPTTPTGWLWCNGQAVSRVTYATLFAAIGTTWGSGDGSTTFNVPDLRGEFLRGQDAGRGLDPNRVFASTQQSQNASHDHPLTMNAVPGHDHPLTMNAVPDHVHGSGTEVTVTAGTGTTIRPDGGTGVKTSAAGGHTPTGTVGTGGAYTPSGSVGLAGGNESRPHNVAILYCIKT